MDEIRVFYDSDGVPTGILTRGHVDRAEFLEAATQDTEASEAMQEIEAESGEPFKAEDVHHHHMVQVTTDDEIAEDEEHRFRWCAPDHAGAEPITIIFCS